MNKPRVVVFDLGKVLVDFDYSLAAKNLCPKCKIGVTELSTVLTSEILYRYETGTLSRENFFQAIQNGTGFTGDIEGFALLFADIFEPIEPMVKLHESLRKRNIPTYIFSNTNDMAIAHIRSRFPFFSKFDGYVLSYEVGAMKPDPKIYEAVEDKCKLKGAEILYIDDRPENIAVGATRAWQVILQQEPDKTIRQVQQLGLLD
jgi:FMN phosphatase YigB (HAD superfamily)